MSSGPVARAIAGNWWVLLLRGLVALVFGIVALAYPLPAVGAFILIFGAFAFADGILTIFQALRFAHPDRGRWWYTILQGLAGLAIAAVAFFDPVLAAATFGVLIAIWAIVTGVLEIAAGLQLRRDVAGEIFLVVAGALSVVVGAILFYYPLGATVAFVYVVAAYAIVAGIALIVLALRLRAAFGRSA
jgi:uncharacterized membrane protein HdeD (DUF308 family)